ncbi:Taurine catabolism dioxygenase TauD [Frankia sp. AiPs1]|uniref:TauD/TfdA dioxygenase family protein n=1 Tax=Frankia sp. AiPa1 TaxID=573492 RepID=UPI00202B9ACE|nr:TauD/TfdA family dioxygenase [Frankia sp. AiPa1]MCL9760545.1 TauD/TfdA family dioxygenase [Frankia sp. AiPa1]
MAETRALSPHLGVEVTDARDLLDDTVIARCLEALKWRGVLLVRGADLDDAGQLVLSHRLGEVVAPGGREIFTITLDPAKNPSAEYLKGTFHWHIDGTTDPIPAKATTLTARHVATSGGGTQFASTYAAFESLPAKEQERYEQLRVVHSFAASQRLVNPNPTEKQEAGWKTVPARETALVWRRHDGRRSLVIGATADHIVGMDPDDSRAVLDELLDWSTQERFRYHHDWQVGDLVIWDNTGILHRAMPYDPASERLMHRTTIEGEETLQ